MKTNSQLESNFFNMDPSDFYLILVYVQPFGNCLFEKCALETKWIGLD